MIKRRGIMKKIISLAVFLAFLLCGCSSNKGAQEAALSEVPVSEASTEPIIPETSTTATNKTINPSDTYTIELKDEEPEPAFTSVNIVCAGDNLIHTPIYRQAKERSTDGTYYDFSYAYQNVAHLIGEADLAILNQETIISDEYEPSTYPSFCSPTDLAEEMLNIGFDAFSISNNHVLDKGEKGLLSTLNFWKTAHPDIPVYGAYENEDDMNNIRMLTVNGIKFAFLGYMEHTNGISLPKDSECRVTYLSNEDLIEEQVRKASETADCVIVSVHFGIEVTTVISQQQYDFAQKLADWGADIIVGTQPHTIQSMEYLDKADGGKSFVFYCLGNFLSAMDNPYSMVEYLGRITVTKDNSSGEITISNPNAVPLINHYDAYYKNIRVYPFSEYTKELASAHGCKNTSYEFFEQVINDNIPSEFMAE